MGKCRQRPAGIHMSKDSNSDGRLNHQKVAKCEIRRPRVKSWFYLLLDEWPGTSDLTSLKTSLSTDTFHEGFQRECKKTIKICIYIYIQSSK